VLAAFVLLPELGLRATIARAAAVNALVFVAAWALARSAPAARRRRACGGARADALAVAARAGSCPLILASGFASFTYEVLWVRLVGHVVGSGTQAFATMLASFLLGIAIGRRSRRGSRRTRARARARLRHRAARHRRGLGRGVRDREPRPRSRRVARAQRLARRPGPTSPCAW
jgi:hypothetical protein